MKRKSYADFSQRKIFQLYSLFNWDIVILIAIICSLLGKRSYRKVRCVWKKLKVSVEFVPAVAQWR